MLTRLAVNTPREAIPSIIIIFSVNRMCLEFRGRHFRSFVLLYFQFKVDYKPVLPVSQILPIEAIPSIIVIFFF